MNLYNHLNEFRFDTIWSFFATSRGKSPCDDIGGRVKSKITQANLQRPVINQILTFTAVEEFRNENIVGITFFSIYKKNMVQFREVLDARYSLKAIQFLAPEVAINHHFEPSSTISIKGKQLSEKHVYTIKDHSFSALRTVSEIVLTLKPNDYAACIFYRFWWFVLGDLINLEVNDMAYNFMHPHCPINNFHWPCTDDMRYVPFNKFIINV